MILPAGYRSRPASWDDLEAVVTLIKACDRADVGLEDPMREHLEDEWRRIGFDLERHTLVVEADGGSAPAAFADVFGFHPERSLDGWVQVHPGHRGRGLGAALVTWTEQRSRALVPAGTTTKLYQGSAATDDAGRALLLHLGYEPVRIFWHMERDLPGPVEPAVAPAGVEIRTYRHEADAVALHDALEGAFLDHWAYEPHPLEASMQEQARMDPGLVWVATAGDEVAGALVSRTVEDTGWIDDVGVRRPWRGRGIARALLLTSFAEHAARGAVSVMLNVDSENRTGATRLYEAVGMRVRRAWHIFEKTLEAA